jgi:hypothetical protein
MNDRIASLTPAQAESAVKELFDLLPTTFFAGDKPTLADIMDLTQEVREEAPADLQPFFQAVIDDSHSARRGEIARVVLDQLSQIPGLSGYMDQALQRALQPHKSMAALVGVVVLVMTVMPRKVQFKDGKLDSFECGHLRDAATLVHEVTEFVKVLPTNVKSFLVGT